MRNIGARIRALRAELALSLPKLAERSKLSQGLLSKLENSEEPNPSLETLQKLAHALKTTVADIIGADVVVSARELPREKPEWMKFLIKSLQAEGKRPDKDILEALYVLQNRKASARTTPEDWKYLYRNIEVSITKQA